MLKMFKLNQDLGANQNILSLNTKMWMGLKQHNYY